MNIDLTHIDNFAMPCTPDVLLLPSKLRQFAKVSRLPMGSLKLDREGRETFAILAAFCKQDVNGTLVVNPGRLTKSRSGGTYAHLRLETPRRNDIPMTEKPLLAGAVDRATLQIVKV